MKRSNHISTETEDNGGKSEHESDLSPTENIDSDESGSEEEEACVVCGDEEATGKNSMIFCDGKGCDIPVHLKCYGVLEVPPGDEKWHCDRCKDDVAVDKTDALCCPVPGGAFKRSNFSNKYIHIPCAWWNKSVEPDGEGYKVEKWLLDKQQCYICNSSAGLTVRCKQPGCPKWYHVMCAVSNETIKLSKFKDIKFNVLCLDHKTDPPKKSNDSTYQDSLDLFEESSEAEELLERSGASSLKRSQQRHHDKTNISKKLKLNSSSKLSIDIKESNLSKCTAIPGLDSWSSLLSKVNSIKSIIGEIEDIPIDIKRKQIPKREPPPIPKEKATPLDSLLDHAFDNSPKEVDIKITEIQELKKKLAELPSIETYQNLLKELQSLKNNNAVNSPLTDINAKVDRLNMIAIFSHLKLPNLPIPTEENISQFLQLFRGILDRSSGTNGAPSPSIEQK